MKYSILVFLLISSISFGHDRPRYNPSYRAIFNIHSEYGNIGYSSKYYDPTYIYIRVPRYEIYEKPRYRVKYRSFNYNHWKHSNKHRNHGKHKKHNHHR